MAALPPWQDLIEGRGCPFCQPREADNQYWLKVGDLNVSSLYLSRNQTYRGYCLLVFNPRHVTGLEQLSVEEYADYFKDVRQAALAVAGVVEAEHMNYASLGNVIPHLHFHIIPRCNGDSRWGAPVWTTHEADMERVTLPEGELVTLAQSLRDALLKGDLSTDNTDGRR